MRVLLGILLVLGAAGFARAAATVSFDSPGLPASQMDEAGRLAADWGTVGVKLSGQGVSDGAAKVEAVKLDGLIPAARATADRGAVRVVTTAYRAPVFPAGVDVLSVRLEEAQGRPAQVTLGLALPEKARLGLRTVRMGNRVVLSLSDEVLKNQPTRDWGSWDESTALAGWAKPDGKCDPAFRSIRAGMGGVPIRYRFKVEPGSRATVALGFCESHWAEPGARPLSCAVEGADLQQVDPIAAWGRHKPGVLVFDRARDENLDGWLDVAVRSAAGAKDRNPILNVIWLFPVRSISDPAPLIAGALNTKALRYVQVGGENDQTLYAGGKLEFPVSLAPGGSKEFVFFVACQDGNAPLPETSPWTEQTLRGAARAVWRDWR